MEGARHWEHTARRTAGRRRSTGGSGRRDRRKVALAPRERRRLLQLCVCAVLFLAVFLGRDALPGGMEEVRGEILQVIRTDTDFRAAFARLGSAMDRGASGQELAAQAWRAVLGMEEPGWTPYVFAARDNALYRVEAERLSEQAGNLVLPIQEAAPTPEAESTRTDQTAQETPAPEGAEEDTDPLGVGETAAPVMAPVSSGFGLREHPIEGGEKFHNGLDLAADYGSDIGAFAAGTVDYIGESPAYGQYLQIAHANGVTSFYAHCSRLCVQPGQQVAAGEKVAEVGDTGEVTGAHLHFELKVNGTLVDPADYIETE